MIYVLGDLRHFGATNSAQDISAQHISAQQTRRRSNSAQAKLGASQTRRKSNSAQVKLGAEKNELTLLYSA